MPTWWRSPRSADREYLPEALEAVRAAADSGSIILTVCSGAFVAGAAGLLDGRPCTTHWMHADELARQYPTAEVDRNVLVRRRRQPDHQRGHRGGHRRLPAPGAARTRQRGHQQDRPPDGGAAAARRRSAAVHRPADPGALLGRLCAATGLDPGRTSTNRTPSPRWPNGRTCRRARSPAGSSRRPAARRCSG